MAISTLADHCHNAQAQSLPLCRRNAPPPHLPYGWYVTLESEHGPGCLSAARHLHFSLYLSTCLGSRLSLSVSVSPSPPLGLSVYFLFIFFCWSCFWCHIYLRISRQICSHEDCHLCFILRFLIFVLIIRKLVHFDWFIFWGLKNLFNWNSVFY